MIVKLKTADGYAVLVNTEHVVHVSQAMTKGGNGSGALQPLLGKCVLGTVTRETFVLSGTVEEVYGALRKGEERASVESTAIRP